MQFPYIEPISVTVARAIEISGLGNTKIYECLKDGRLRSKMVDGRRLIDFQSLKALCCPINELGAETTPERPADAAREKRRASRRGQPRNDQPEPT